MSEPKDDAEAPQVQPVPFAPESELSDEDLEQAAGGVKWEPDPLPQPDEWIDPIGPPLTTFKV